MAAYIHCGVELQESSSVCSVCGTLSRSPESPQTSVSVQSDPESSLTVHIPRESVLTEPFLHFLVWYHRGGWRHKLILVIGFLCFGFVYYSIRIGLDEWDSLSTLKKAEAGDATAMFKLAQLYEEGHNEVTGWPKDEHQAEIWYEKAASAGNARSMWLLANSYYWPWHGFQKDVPQAIRWFAKSAAAGDKRSMGTLAYIYREDKMVKNDHTAALWSRLAAGAGDSEGMYSLGIMYEQGRGGLPKDASQAVSWYRKAADAGDSDAMYALGTIYEQGRGGLPKDIPQAVSWYRKAAKAEFVTDNAKQALQRLGY